MFGVKLVSCAVANACQARWTLLLILARVVKAMKFSCANSKLCRRGVHVRHQVGVRQTLTKLKWMLFQILEGL